MNGDQITFYFEVAPYPTAASRIAGNVPTQASHLTLEGAIQNFLDGVHMILRSFQAYAAFGGDAASFGEVPTLAQANAQIDQLAQFWPRFYLDSLTPGKTAEQTAAEYKQQAAALFAAYGL